MSIAEDMEKARKSMLKFQPITKQLTLNVYENYIRFKKSLEALEKAVEEAYLTSLDYKDLPFKNIDDFNDVFRMYWKLGRTLIYIDNIKEYLSLHINGYIDALANLHDIKSELDENND
jgi:hypothetical protein